MVVSFIMRKFALIIRKLAPKRIICVYSANFCDRINVIDENETERRE